MNGVMVESPGTAPGSEPPIAGAFITIVRIAPDPVNIGALPPRAQAARRASGQKFSKTFANLFEEIWSRPKPCPFQPTPVLPEPPVLLA